MRRSLLTTTLAAALVLGVVLPLLAQDTFDISLGGGTVARIRDKGPYASVAERAAKIDQKINEVLSTKDTLHPVVTLKQKDGIWTVYCWDIAVMGVYPAEAKANNLSEKQLGAVWVKAFQQRLPLATPLSKMPPPKPGSKPAAAGPAGSAATKPATAETTSPPEATAETGPAKESVTPVSGNESGALLLITDALRIARELPEKDWVTQKETIARNLFTNLCYYVTGKGTPPKLPASGPELAPSPGAKPAPSGPAKPTPSAQPPSKPVTKPVTRPVAKPVAKPVTAATAGSPAYAKVPQKNRIREKFALAQQPYEKLLAADPEAAKPITELLAGSRKAFGAGDFDESERLIDAALKALGVTPTE